MAVLDAPDVADPPVKEVDDKHLVRQTLERSRLWAIQTPQTFPVKVLKRAYEESYRHKVYGTDDAMLVERAGVLRLISARLATRRERERHEEATRK